MRFLKTTQHFHVETSLLFDQTEKLLPIPCLTHRTGRHRGIGVYLLLGDNSAPLAQDLDDALHRLVTKEAIAVYTFAQVQEPSICMRLSQPAIVGDISNEQPAGKGPNVNSS
jgi:hypothetical protein